MKHLLMTLALLAGVGAATSAATFRLSGDAKLRAAVANRDALEWLRHDFELDAAQFAKIKQLHDAYSSVCERHCHDIMEATRLRNTLQAASAKDSAAVAAATLRVEQLREVCETAIAAHVRDCAAVMSARARERYLTLILPKIADFDHRAPPDVRLSHTSH